MAGTLGRSALQGQGNRFVRRAHRRSAVAAILFELGIQSAQNDGACALHAQITSENLGSKALENMFSKYGFTVIGSMMGRSL